MPQFRVIPNKRNQTWREFLMNRRTYKARRRELITMSDCVYSDKPFTFLAHCESLLSSVYVSDALLMFIRF